MIVKLKDYEVEIKDELGWWDLEDIKAQWKAIGKFQQAELGTSMQIDPNTIMKIMLRLIELAIVSIKKGEEKVNFSESWIKGLSKADGDTLWLHIDKLSEGMIDLGEKKT